MRPWGESVIAEYTAAGYWDDESLAERIRRNAKADPDGAAFIESSKRLFWRAYDEQSTGLAAMLAASGLEPEARLGVFLPDGPAVHVAFTAAEKAGLVVVGIGPRSRANEIRHILEVTGCTAILTEESHRGESAADLVAEQCRAGWPLESHFVLHENESCRLELSLDGEAVPEARAGILAGRALGPNDLVLINSTSGTTGLPKCVMQTQNRWKYFHQPAAEAGEFTGEDIFMSVIPAPFGFGLWTAHYSPTLLGVPTVLMREFDAEGALAAIERERVTVLTCVSTQFVMMLNSPDLDRFDLTSLRVMFTGGERVPFNRAAEFEEKTGCLVLQFYGSNEAGAVSRTTTKDTRERRLMTSGQIIPEMNVRVVDQSGADVAGLGKPGVCLVKGPATTPGYYNDSEANAQLFREGGWIALGDLVEVDAEGYLTVVGREADIIIRGGHNISAVAVEEVLLAHPRVAVAGVVGMPDEVFGERVCAFVETKDRGPLELDELTSFLAGQGVSKYMWPERVIVLQELPRGASGKIEKARLRERLRAQVAR